MPMDPNDRDTWIRLLDDPKQFEAEQVKLADGARINLSGADLSGRDLKALFIGAFDLSGAKLKGARIWLDRLIICRLQNIDLTGAIVDSRSGKEDDGHETLRLLLHLWNDVAAFNRARPKEIVALRWDLSGCDLRKANLSEGLMSSCNLNGADLSGATIQDTRFMATSLRGTKFVGSKLSTIEFQKCDLTEVDFSDAQLHGILAQKSIFSRSRFDRAKGDDISFGGPAEGSSFQDAVLKRIRFGFAKLGGADFSRVQLEKGRFLESDFSKASFRGARITEFAIEGCRFDGVDATDATGLPPPPVPKQKKPRPKK